MRMFLILISGLVLTQATLSKASDQDFDQEAVEYVNSFAAPNAPTWNRWNCIATRPLDIRQYRGSSFYFRGGSGEGQTAKAVAQKIALRACQFATNASNCTADLAKCTVEVH